MKKLLFLVAMVAFTLSANAQKIFLNGSNGKTLDTLSTNGSIEYLTTPSNALNAASPYGGYDLQLNWDSLSGTQTITAVLQSSIDGIRYSNHFKCAGTNGISCDTLSIANATLVKQHIWTILSNHNGFNYNSAGTAKQSNSGRRLYFRIMLIAGATQSTPYSAQLIVQN